MGVEALLLAVTVGLVLFFVVGSALRIRGSARPSSPHLPQHPQAANPETMSIEELIRAGHKIPAIKRYREQTGVGLKEAKDAVEAMETGTPVPLMRTQPLTPSADGLSAVEDFIRSGQKIQAIKAYREQTGVGLKEAKDAVDALERQLFNR